MTKIMKYEIRILLLKPYIFFMTIVTMLYSFFILSTKTILGVSDTAPYSGWSFGNYLGESILISMIVTLFILSVTYSERYRKSGVLTDVTAFSETKKILIRSVIIGGYFLVSSLLALVMGCIFMKSLFGEMYSGTYLGIWLLITVPALFLILGVGNLLGRIQPLLIYVFMAVIIAMAYIMKGFAIDPSGAGYFEVMSARLESLNGGETAFVIEGTYILNRVIYLLLGVAALMLNLAKAGRKKTKDF